jgi:hypothetical protein
MPKQIKRSSKRIIHAIAHCEECDFQAEWYLTAAREATKHCRETGHRVGVELGLSYHLTLTNL